MIEMGKKYRTRDGREARIYAVYSTGKWCVHGAIKSESDDLWWPHQWTADGAFQTVANGTDCSSADLIEVKPEVTVRKVLVGSADDSMLLDAYAASKLGRRELGAIDITHDGEKLIRVEIVK